MENKELYCDHCGEVIEKGSNYAEIDIGNIEYVHEDCVDDYFDGFESASVTWKICGKEEE